MKHFGVYPGVDKMKKNKSKRCPKYNKCKRWFKHLNELMPEYCSNWIKASKECPGAPKLELKLKPNKVKYISKKEFNKLIYNCKEIEAKAKKEAFKYFRIIGLKFANVLANEKELTIRTFISILKKRGVMPSKYIKDFIEIGNLSEEIYQKLLNDIELLECYSPFIQIYKVMDKNIINFKSNK